MSIYTPSRSQRLAHFIRVFWFDLIILGITSVVTLGVCYWYWKGGDYAG